MSHWQYSNKKGCATETIRHAICLLGLEDVNYVSKYPNIMVNKFMPEFDYAGIDCVHEDMFNRTYFDTQLFNTTYYREMASVCLLPMSAPTHF